MAAISSRRILILGAHDAGTLDIIKDLTGTRPQPSLNGSTAGLTHEWFAETPYYTAKISIWIDEISSANTWKTEFLKPDAAEVVEAVGAWIYVYTGPLDAEVEESLRAIQEVVDEHTPGSEAVCLAVGKSKQEQPSSAENEDTCMQYNFEYIDYVATGKNSFGEKQGFERLKEALEANEWTSLTEGEDAERFLDDLDLDEGFDREEAEMTAELFGMKAALNTDDGEDEAGDTTSSTQQAGGVDDLDRMLSQLLAIKEQSAGLPEEQRKRMAAQAVRDIMKGNPNV